MEAILIILSIYLCLYIVYIARQIMGFGQVAEFTETANAPTTTFSIIVPFRNEEKNLPILLESIVKLQYPIKLFEVILIDDGSSDHGQSVVYRWRMQNGSLHVTLLENIRRSGSPKKDAISRAIPIATGDWIVTTDADCRLPVGWLATLDAHIKDSATRMVAGPVGYFKSCGILGMFQNDDLLAMQGSTIGGFGIGKPFMCNGANFAYEKKLFHELGGFSGNADKPGGDDVFMLHKAIEKNQKVTYMKSREAVVLTHAETSWSTLFWQRVRWASKASTYRNEFAEDVSLAVLAGNAAIVIVGILAAVQKVDWLFFAGVFSLKFLPDWILMIRTNRFLRRQKIVFPVLSAVIYPVFNLCVAVFAVRGRFLWKGRKWG